MDETTRRSLPVLLCTILAILPLPAGCSSTAVPDGFMSRSLFSFSAPPGMSDQADEPNDGNPFEGKEPFRTETRHDDFAAIGEDPFLKSLASTKEVPHPRCDPEPAPSVPASDAEPNDEELRALSLLEEKLAGNHWVKNLELPRWRENGMKDPNTNRDTEKLRRLNEIQRLNMSEKDRNKRENVFEYSPGLISTRRWYHREIEELSRIPTERRADPSFFLRDPKYRDKNHQILRTNAAILMGRDGDPLAADYLFEAVADAELRSEPLRCAAAETLGTMQCVSIDDLIDLIDRVREGEYEIIDRETGTTETKFRSGSVLLWAELLEAVAERIKPWEHPCFLEPLESRNGKMRWETARIWRFHSISGGAPPFPSRLPEQYLAFAEKETAPEIRVEIVRTLGAWKEPDILEYVRNDLNREALVRNAAMDALAEANCRESIPLIKEKLYDLVGTNRAKAVETLRKLDSLDDVFRQADDKSRDVRLQVAKAIARRRAPQTVALAERYLADTEAIRAATVEAVASWPIEAGGPILLEALKNDLPAIRVQAAEALERFVPEVAEFDATASPKSQAESFDELVRSFQRRVSPHDPKKRTETSRSRTAEPDRALLDETRRCLDDWCRPNLPRDKRDALARRLTELGDRLYPTVEHLYAVENRAFPPKLDLLLAQTDPFFAQIVKLDSENVSVRRKAASALVGQAGNREHETYAVRRILDRALAENDPWVLASLLEALKRADGNSARPLAIRLLASDSQGLRLRACEMLGTFADPGDLRHFAELLHDSSREVQRSALEGIAEIVSAFDDDDFSEERSELTETLLALLTRNDPFFQTDIAATLHLLGHAEGKETIRRLSLSPDYKVRLYVVKTVVALEDPVFTPILLAGLDDVGGVRSAALSGLPKLAGEEIDAAESDAERSDRLPATEETVAKWKRWAENQVFRENSFR